MTLDEAIEIETINNEHNPNYTDAERHKAHQISIEAMKHIRDPKFRAWDTDRKEMVTEGAFIQVWGNGEYAIYHEDEQEWESSYHIIMQYTGLKDKHDKECYWNDWVTDGINPKFLVTPDYHLLARLSEIEFEVIGNVYSNPELLKEG